MSSPFITHIPANAPRTLRRFTLPADLVARLDVEASARGIATARLVEQIVADVMPSMLADAAAAYVRRSIARADDLEGYAYPCGESVTSDDVTGRPPEPT